MAHNSPGTARATMSSYSQQSKSPRDMNKRETSATDYSVFIGYGTNAKRIKDRWEATKRLLRFENNYIALKWLLDSFVDEYLKSKQMTDTIAATAESSRKDMRKVEEGVPRQMATRSPLRTHFEDVSDMSHRRSLSDMSPPASVAQSTLKDQKPRLAHDGVRMVSGGDKGYMQLQGQYSYKYWSPYYPWPSNVPVNPRLMPISSLPAGYSGYMVKTPSCSSLSTPQREEGHLKRWGSANVVKHVENNPEKKEQRATVNLGFKTKSMPNLQCIPKEEAISDEEEDTESDPESQGDLIALSSSSLSMPNLHKIPGERAPHLSPPSGRRYNEQLLGERLDYCSSSYSMPNLQAIHGMNVDDRKKTIRDFVINRLTKNDVEEGGVKTKIFNPNGYFMPPRIHDPEKKLVKQDIRRRLLQRIEAKRQSEESHTEVSPSKRNEKLFKPVPNKLPRVSENRMWTNKGFQEGLKTRGGGCLLGKDDKVNNNWKVPVSGVGPSGVTRDSKGITWNDTQMNNVRGAGSSIWNPADVHVKKEVISEEAVDGSETASCTSNGKSPTTVSPTKVASQEDEKMDGGAEEEKGESSDDEQEEEENIDVESYKDGDATMDDSGCSESELDGTCEDGKKNKRTRKPDNPKKRLKV